MEQYLFHFIMNLNIFFWIESHLIWNLYNFEIESGYIEINFTENSVLWNSFRFNFKNSFRLSKNKNIQINSEVKQMSLHTFMLRQSFVYTNLLYCSHDNVSFGSERLKGFFSSISYVTNAYTNSMSPLVNK